MVAISQRGVIPVDQPESYSDITFAKNVVFAKPDAQDKKFFDEWTLDTCPRLKM